MRQEGEAAAGGRGEGARGAHSAAPPLLPRPQERAMWGGLVDMYEAGLVRAVGVSNYGPKQLAKIARYAARIPHPL